MNPTYDIHVKRDVSSEEREKLKEQGQALPDGSFPIANVSDLKNAVQAYGRAKDKSRAKKHIIKRARELDAVDSQLPESWDINNEKSAEGDNNDTPDVARTSTKDVDTREAGREAGNESRAAAIAWDGTSHGDDGTNNPETKVAGGSWGVHGIDWIWEDETWEMYEHLIPDGDGGSTSKPSKKPDTPRKPSGGGKKPQHVEEAQGREPYTEAGTWCRGEGPRHADTPAHEVDGHAEVERRRTLAVPREVDRRQPQCDPQR